VRLFIAMDIPEEVRNAVRDFISKLARTAHGARWVRPEGMHLTLKFIGEAKPETVEQIKSQLHDVRSAAPVEVRFQGVGFFPNARRPRVLWVGIESSANLAELADGIEKRMETLGIPRESRAFKPHLTLARFDPQKPPGHLGEEIDRLGAPEFGSACTAEFHLYQSVLKRSGAEYRRLESFQFLKPAS
jgi:2'-5' RNA ligase